MGKGSSQTVNESVELDPEIKSRLFGILDDTTAQTFNPDGTPKSFTAGRTDAFNQFQNTARATPRISGAEFGTLAERMQTLPLIGLGWQGGDAAQIGSSPTVAAGRGKDFMGDYESKYTNDVVDTAIGDLRAERDKSQLASELAAEAAGASGGSRQGVRDAEVQSDYLRNVAGTTANLRDRAFGLSAQLGMSDADRKLSADSTTAQLKAAIDEANARFRQNQQQFDQTGSYNAKKDLSAATAQGLRDAASSLNIGSNVDLANTAMLGTAAQMDQGQAQLEAQDPLTALQMRLAAAGLLPNLTTTSQTTTQKPGLFDWLSLGAKTASAFAP